MFLKCTGGHKWEGVRTLPDTLVCPICLVTGETDYEQLGTFGIQCDRSDETRVQDMDPLLVQSLRSHQADMNTNFDKRERGEINVKVKGPREFWPDADRREHRQRYF